MAKKKPKSSKIGSWLNTGPKKLMVFVLAFAIIGGGFATYISFAATSKTHSGCKIIAGPKVHEEISNGSAGKCVQHLQKMMYIVLDINKDPDGIFGEDTERDVKKLQGRCDLPKDGIVGRKTWACIHLIYDLG